jgi:hypothetical protein
MQGLATKLPSEDRQWRTQLGTHSIVAVVPTASARPSYPHCAHVSIYACSLGRHVESRLSLHDVPAPGDDHYLHGICGTTAQATFGDRTDLPSLWIADGAICA